MEKTVLELVPLRDDKRGYFMKNSIVALNRNEINNVIGGASLLDSSLDVVKGAIFPIVGIFISYGIIKILSKKHTG